MNQDWKFYLILSLSAICIGVIMFWVILNIEIINFQYEMPNGVICNCKEIVSACFGGAGIEFKKCSDGKTYFNPKTYRRIKR